MHLNLGGGSRSDCICTRSSGCMFRIQINVLDTERKREGAGRGRKKEEGRKERREEGTEGGRRRKKRELAHSNTAYRQRPKFAPRLGLLYVAIKNTGHPAFAFDLVAITQAVCVQSWSPQPPCERA